MAILFTSPGIRGIGDALFLSAVAREFKRIDSLTPVVVHSRNFELFYNNPDVDLIICGYDESRRMVRVLRRETRYIPQVIGYRWAYNVLVLQSGLFGHKFNAHHGWPPKKRLLDEVAERCGLQVGLQMSHRLRPYFFPYKHEIDKFSDLRGVVCVHSTAATYWTPNKQWPVDRMQQVVDWLNQFYRVVQLGAHSDFPLSGVIDLRGRLTIRETGAILSVAKLFVGMEGGLMHLARAVNTRSVIIFTGFITPEYSGYDVNVNLFGPKERTDLPCWNREKCNCNCAERVSVKDVIDAVTSLIDVSQPVGPLVS